MDIPSFDLFKNLAKIRGEAKRQNMPPKLLMKTGVSGEDFPVARLHQVDTALTAARIFPLRAARRPGPNGPVGISVRPRWSNSSKTRLAAPRAHTSSPQ